tara:strand:- start:230 stop:433 length:204 start_codon:yes stop_codon:yes gene_type:complete
LGLAVYRAEFSRFLDLPRRAEYAFEALYQAQATPWLAIGLNGQLIHHPGGSNNRAAIVAGLRVTLTL